MFLYYVKNIIQVVKTRCRTEETFPRLMYNMKNEKKKTVSAVGERVVRLSGESHFSQLQSVADWINGQKYGFSLTKQSDVAHDNCSRETFRKSVSTASTTIGRIDSKPSERSAINVVIK